MIFNTTKEQDQEIHLWKKEHSCDVRTDNYGMQGEIYVGAIGGALTYEFTPTGLGTVEIVKCVCGQTLNLTDTGKW